MSFSCKKLVVIGAGLIGGSLIKSLRKNHCDVAQIVAVGRNLEVLERAKAQGFIDDYSNDSSQAVKGADIVVIGTPVGSIAEQFNLIYENLSAQCIISDVGSVKAQVVASAKNHLHDKFESFVPAHPISGTEHSGFDASFAELFEGRNTVITPTSENSREQISTIKSMWQQTGSHVLEMNFDTHDKVFAATSHLPHILAYALVNAISGLDDADNYFQVVAGGFLDYTRIASSDAIMWRDVCMSNQKPILEMIEIYQAQLSELENMIKNKQAKQLEEQFINAKAVRDKLVDKRLQEKQENS